MMSTTYCPGELSLFNTFDLSYAPVLLYYSYIPILFASLILSIFILIKDKRSLMSKLLFAIAVVFALWVLNIILQWITVPAHLNYFEWQITPFLEILIPIFSIYFVAVFLEKEDTSLAMKLFLSAVASLVALLLPTKFNTISFDVPNCQANLGPLIYFVYSFEIFSIFFILFLCIKKYISSDSNLIKKQILFLAIGVVFFLGIFSIGQIFGEITKVCEINLVGPVGMLLFIGMLSYMIVKFKVFNAKLFASQALILALLFFIISLLFIQQIDIIHIVILFTFGLVSILGASLIKSVKREIEQREKIEKLAVDLESANRQKDTVLHLVAHQLNGPVSVVNFTTELMLAGDFDPLTEQQKKAVADIRRAGENMKDQSEMILVAAKISAGAKLPLELAPLDLNTFFSGIINEGTLKAKERNVNLQISIPPKLPTVLLDRKFTQWAISNLLNNAIKYTALKLQDGSGKVDFTVEAKKGVLRCVVKDNGIGIPEGDKSKMFQELSRASNAG